MSLVFGHLSLLSNVKAFRCDRPWRFTLLFYGWRNISVWFALLKFANIVLEDVFFEVWLMVALLAKLKHHHSCIGAIVLTFHFDIFMLNKHLTFCGVIDTKKLEFSGSRRL